MYKNGVANPGLAQNLHLDTFSFTYDAEPAPTGDCTVDAYNSLVVHIPRRNHGFYVTDSSCLVMDKKI